ncbi:MAG: class I SAM-dependent methyltransferase [Lachnospiraceae bacterium]|nr:class I SAM-dependent methyltransferase [Lachnospiraceae bacterium]
MEAYTGFARVYDLFMDNVPYGEWSRYLLSLLKEYGAKDGIVLELGCGTGKMTRLLSRAGYDMIGIDNSEEMLQMAREAEDEAKEYPAVQAESESREDILYLLQDMREFELYGTVKAVVSICDCVNYILEEEELLQVFRLVNNYLDPGGVFIFDLNTLYKYREVLGENVICENREEGSFIWENFYDEKEKLNQYDLTLFLREEESSPLYRKYEETHFQRGYELKQVKMLLEQAGMEVLAVYDGYTREPVRDDSQRVTVIAREKGK